jgi:hypothetical protein
MLPLPRKRPEPEEGSAVHQRDDLSRFVGTHRRIRQKNDELLERNAE